MAFDLRPYQREALDAVSATYAAGIWAQLLVLPTGGGKTVIFAQVPRLVRGRMLVLAHREELLTQAASSIRAANPDLRVEIEQAEQDASWAADVVVASVQTMRRARLQLWPRDHFASIVVDEAHHSAAQSYHDILTHFGAHVSLQLPRKPTPEQCVTARASLEAFWRSKRGPLLLGVTATPDRDDNRGLEWIFERVVYRRSIEDLIQGGYLVPLAGRSIATGVDLAAVRTVAGDFDQRQLATVVNTPERNLRIVRAWMDFAENRRTLLFGVDVEHARMMAELFTQAGVPADFVSGELARDDRRQRLAGFRSGRTRVLANYGVLTEGFDDPGVSCIVMARPTRSQALYIQMIGRGTRLSEGKNDCLVLDVADVSRRHSLVQIGSVMGLPPNIVLAGERVADVQTVLKQIEAFQPGLDMGGWTFAKMQQTLQRLQTATAREINFWQVPPSPEVARFSKLTWQRAGTDRYALSVVRGDMRGQVVLTRDTLGEWQLRDFGAVVAQVSGEIGAALQAADTYVARAYPQTSRLSRAEAPWRKKPVTPNQQATLQKIGAPMRAGLTSGEASDMISRFFQSRAR